MKKMIYIPDRFVGEIEAEARRLGKSFSGYLVGLHRERFGGVVLGSKFCESDYFKPYSKEVQLKNG